MANPKQQIELECQQVKEQLLKLIADRSSLKQELEELTKNSQRVLQQIQEDSTRASEGKLHSYEAEKKRIEEKLESLEKEIVEKDKKIAILDARAGDYLLQVSTTSNSLCDDVEKVEKLVVGSGEGGGNTSAVTVGEGEVSVEGARVGGNEFEAECNVKSDEKSSQVKADTVQILKEEKLDVDKQKINVSDDFGEMDKDQTAKKVVSEASEQQIDHVSYEKEPREKLSHEGDGNTAVAAVGSASKSLVDETSDKLERKMTSEVNEFDGEFGLVDKVKDKKCEKKELVQKESVDVRMVDEGETEEEESVEETDDEELVDDVGITKGTETEKEIEMAEKDNLNHKVKILDEGEGHDRDEISYTPMQSGVSKCNEELLRAAAPLPTAVCASASIVNGISENDTELKQSTGSGSPVRDQMVSLSVLVAELRRVKDDMGKCMSLKEQSFIELEDQLQAANKEVISLKASMSRLSKDLEEKEHCYHALEEENKKKKMDIELKMSEIQDVTNKCTMLGGEKSDLLRKMEVLEIMMTEYRTEIEMLITEKSKMEEQTKELLSAQTAASKAEAEIDARTNIEEKEKEIEELLEKIQNMEKEIKESNDKLKVTNRHLKVMAREREHKQKECDVLKRKVEMVELKMCELQGTFDRLVKAVMVERDDVIKEMEEKTIQIDDLQQTLVRLKDTHEQELENVLYEKKLIDDELSKYKSGELRSTVIPLVEKKDLDAVIHQKEMLELQVKQKTEETQLLQVKVKSIQDDMTDFVKSLKDEMSRLKEESEKLKIEKASSEETFTMLQAEHLEMTNKYKSLEKSFQELEKSSEEKTANLEALRLQLDDLQQQLEDLNAKNFSLTTEMYRKEEEFKEELSAREGTIQELTLTLTNNQKQSMENYNALQEDMNSLDTKYKSLLEENKKQVREMEEKLKSSEEEKYNESKELQEKISSLVEEMKEKQEEVRGLQMSAQPEDRRSLSVLQDAELPSCSSPTSYSVISEEECRKYASKEKQIEALAKRGIDLEEALKATQKKLETKENELKTLVESVSMHQTIKDLSEEFVDVITKSAASGNLRSHSEFEADLAVKEEKIRILESKVSDLEMCLTNKSGYITQLEGRLEGALEVQNNVESHLKQISNLSSDISKLKEELRRSCGECELLRKSIIHLENDKMKLENEKAKLVDDYDRKLQHAIVSLEEAKVDLEKKKNSVERLELKLSSSSSRHVEEVAKLESNHIGRVAELVKLHRQKVEELKASNAARVSELLKHISDICEEKVALEEELGKVKLEYNENLSTKMGLLQERNNLQAKVQVLQQTVDSLEKETLQIEEEKLRLKSGFEEEQMMTVDMQNQMVSDLEKLILNLESEKGTLEKKVVHLEASCDLHCETILEGEKKVAMFEDLIINIAQEKEMLKVEMKKLKEMIGEETLSQTSEDYQHSKATEELNATIEKLKNSLEYAQESMEEQEEIYADKLKEARDDHLMQLKALRKELLEEVGVVKDEKEQVVVEYEDRIALIIAEHQEQLSTMKNKHESQILEEKAEFGRVLVAKIDQYESRLAAQSVEVKSYETQLDALHSDIDEKVKVINELECNLDDMTLMRAALRAQVDDLKLTITKMNKGKESDLDVLHSEYESRIAEVQEHYEAQLSYLHSLLSGTDFEVQTAGCSSPSQGSEYSIELSCLRPYLQGQSSPVADFMAELRTQSVQGSHFGIGGDNESHASSQSFHLLVRSSSGANSKEETQSYSSTDCKIGSTSPSSTTHLRTKSISKAKSKCKSNGSIPRVVLNSSSRSELRLLQYNLGSNSEPQAINTKSQVKQTLPMKPQQTDEISAHLSNPDPHSPEQPKIRARYEPQISIPNPNSPAASVWGPKPRLPRRGALKLNSSPLTEPSTAGDKEPQLAFSTAISSTTQPSDPDPNNTALDKYRIKVEMSTCCVVQ